MKWYKFYGLDTLIRDYAGLPSNVPLVCHFDHGWTPLTEAYNDCNTEEPLMLVMSRRRLQAWNKVSSIPAAIMGSPFVHYRKSRKIEQDVAASGTIAFPAHSTRLTETVFDIDKYCKQLLSLPIEYHPITICIHFHDLARKRDEIYKKYGFKIVTAGSAWAPGFEFVQKFYEILRNHKYATSNQVGTYSFYAVEMGIPFFIFGEPAVIVNQGAKLVPAISSYTDHPMGVFATKIFQGPTQIISKEQRNFVEEELGVHDCLSGIELRELLIESNNRAIEAYEESLSTGQGRVGDKLSTCEKLVSYFQGSGEMDKQLKYIFKSFEYAAPKAEFCCHLGYFFNYNKQYELGVFWYKLATQLEKPDDSWLMWAPHVQLCLCYDHLGKHELAYEHNEIARSIKPDHPSIWHNKKYLESVLGKTTKES